MNRQLVTDIEVVLKQGEFWGLGNLEICYAGVAFDGDEAAVIDFNVLHCERSWLIHCYCTEDQEDKVCYVSGDNGDRHAFFIKSWGSSFVRVQVEKIQED